MGRDDFRELAVAVSPIAVWGAAVLGRYAAAGDWGTYTIALMTVFLVGFVLGMKVGVALGGGDDEGR